MSYIVVWDDEQGLCCPMSWDPECDGAICGWRDEPVALFQSRQEARKAIRISAAHARLQVEQGKLKPDGSDFLGAAAKCIRIVPLKGKAQP